MSLLKSVIKKALWKAGYSVQPRVINQPGENTMEAALARLASLGLRPGTIIDVGAAQGTWTLKALDCWPNASYELLEPLEEQSAALASLKANYPNTHHHLAVAGKEAGIIQLNVSDDLDGSGIYGDASENAREVAVMALDDIAAARKGPFIIKLDTHGYEVPILEGAKKMLSNTDALIIEVYGFHVSPTCLLFHELSAYLHQSGFRLIDIVDTMRRPGDRAFWQADAVYLRKDNPVFGNNNYA